MSVVYICNISRFCLLKRRNQKSTGFEPVKKEKEGPRILGYRWYPETDKSVPKVNGIIIKLLSPPNRLEPAQIQDIEPVFQHWFSILLASLLLSFPVLKKQFEIRFSYRFFGGFYKHVYKVLKLRSPGDSVRSFDSFYTFLGI